MNKKIVGIFFIILLVTPITIAGDKEKKDEIYKTETILFSQPIISEKGEYITVDVAESTSNSIGKDKPELPIVTKTYMLPFNTQVADVEISFSNIKKVILTKPIIPAPEPQMLSSTYNSKEINKSEDFEYYADLDIYPEQRYDFRIGSGIKDGQRMKFVNVHLKPIQYIPKDNMICYSDSATIQIKYSPCDNPIYFPDLYDLLIITPAEFTDELQPLVEYKNDNEIPTIMITLDDIPEQGVDLQEDIKYYIKDAIETLGITYVLLVGSGVKGEEKFPVRYAFCSPYILEENFPCDSYYADIYNYDNSFSTWNYDNDDRYFEYPTDLTAVDIYPDVYIGRLACNNANEVITVVNKIINYEEHNKMTNMILQIGGDTFPRDNECVYEGEFQNKEVLKKLQGYTTTKLWGSLDNLNKLNIKNGFMDGVDFVDIAGHGYPSFIATHPPNNLNTWIPQRSPISPVPGFLSIDYDLFSFNNDFKLPVVVYNACLCSRFNDLTDCIGWKTVSKKNGGGIASFGYTTTIDGGVGENSLYRWAGWNEVKIFEEMFNNKILGLCWSNCIIDYINSFNLNAHDITLLLSFTLFGDPTLAIEDGKEPKIKLASYGNLWSDNFDSYDLGQFLDGTSDDGGWNPWFNNPIFGAFVVDDYARSTPHSIKINNTVDIVHEFTNIRSGNLTFRDWIYVPSGSNNGESCIAFFSYYFPNQYLTYNAVNPQIMITFDANNKIVLNDGFTDTLPLIFDEWVELHVEIDLESDWVECFYNDELLMAQSWSHGFSNGYLNFACIDLFWYVDEDFLIYHDDMSIYNEGINLEPNLQCNGSLLLTCKGGEKVSDTFTIQNIGDPESRLEWIVYDAPEYSPESFWLFYPAVGKLTPEDGELTVTATLTAPEEIGDYTGVIKIHAIGNPFDSCEIPVTLTVSKTKTITLFNILERFVYRFPFFEKILNQII